VIEYSNFLKYILQNILCFKGEGVIFCMGERDEFLEVMSKSVDKWVRARPEVNVFGSIVGKNPDYVSILYKEKDEAFWTFLNGVEDAVKEKSTNSGYSVRAVIGDEAQGYGQAWSARDGIPRSPALLEKLMDPNLDLAVKSAVSSYLGFISGDIVYEKDLFSRLSSEKVDSCSGKKIRELSVCKNIRKSLADFTREMYEDGVVREADATISTNLSRQRFVDSDGRRIREDLRLGKIYLEGKFAHNNGQVISHLESMVFVDGVNVNELDRIKNNFCATVGELKNAVTPTSDYYPVILSGGAAGTMIHEALGGHLLSGKYIKDGISTVFKGRIGSLVLPEFLSIVDDPRLKGASGSYLFDDEGIASERVVLIENGILRNYLLDRGSAGYFKMRSNGRSRMEWVTGYDGIVAPEPRVSNLSVSSKNCVSEVELEEIAKKSCVELGKECVLYIDSGIGEVNIGTSEFAMVPSRAYKIFPDGRREPAHNFVMVANAYELLGQIAVTGNKYEVGNGTCGSNSGWVPTQNVSPSMFIPQVNIQAIDGVKFKKELL